MSLYSHFTLAQSPAAPNSARHVKRYRCNYCSEHARTEGLPPPPTVAGRSDSLKSHLRNCGHAPRDVVSPRRPPPRPANAAHPVLSTPPRPAVRFFSSEGESESDNDSESESKGEDAGDVATANKLQELLLRMVVSTGLPFDTAQSSSFVRLISCLNPAAAKMLPTSEDLGGRILNEHADKCDKELREALRAKLVETGGRVNVLGDFFCSIRRRHAMGLQLSLFGRYAAEPFYASDSDTPVSIAYTFDECLRRVVRDNWRVGAVVMENHVFSARARRMLALRWANITFLPCLAYDINSLFQVLLSDRRFFGAIYEATALIDEMHMQRTPWLAKVVKCMKRAYGRSFKIFWTDDEQWTSLQSVLASLLRVRSALADFHRRHAKDEKFPNEFHVLSYPDYWEQLEKVEAIISVMTEAEYGFQSHKNTLADAVAIFQNLYTVLGDSKINNQALLDRLEAMWYSREQPLFILAYHLHPAMRERTASLNVTAISNNHVVTEFAVYYFRNYIDPQVGPLREEMEQWLSGGGEPVVQQDCATSPVGYWLRVQKLQKYPSLARLAIAILSMAANASLCVLPFEKHGPVDVQGDGVEEVMVEHKRNLIRMSRERKRTPAEFPHNQKLMISPLESSLKSPRVLAEPVLTGDPSQEAEEFCNTDCPGLWKEQLQKFLKNMEKETNIEVQDEEPDYSITFDDEPIRASLQGPLRWSCGYVEEEPKRLQGIRGLKVRLATLFGKTSS